MHAKRLDPVIPEEFLLTTIDVAQTNIHQFPGVNDLIILQPAENILLLLASKSGQKGHRHAVDVPTRTQLGRVDIGVRIDPDHSDLPTQSLADGLGRPRNGPDGDRVVTTEGEGEPALLGVVVHLLAQLARDGAHGAGLLHASMVRVGAGQDGFVEMNLFVMVDLIAQVVTKLVDKSGFDEGQRGRFDAWLALLGG